MQSPEHFRPHHRKQSSAAASQNQAQSLNPPQSQSTTVELSLVNGNGKAINEAALLRIAIAIFSVKNPALSPITSFAGVTGYSEQGIRNCLKGKHGSFLSAAAWLAIERQIDFPIYRQWLNILAEER